MNNTYRRCRIVAAILVPTYPTVLLPNPYHWGTFLRVARPWFGLSLAPLTSIFKECGARARGADVGQQSHRLSPPPLPPLFTVRPTSRALAHGRCLAAPTAFFFFNGFARTFPLIRARDAYYTIFCFVFGVEARDMHACMYVCVSLDCLIVHTRCD